MEFRESLSDDTPPSPPLGVPITLDSPIDTDMPPAEADTGSGDI